MQCKTLFRKKRVTNEQHIIRQDDFLHLNQTLTELSHVHKIGIQLKMRPINVLWGPIDSRNVKRAAVCSVASSLKLDYLSRTLLDFQFSLWHNPSKLVFCSLSFRNSSALLVSEDKHGSQNIFSRRFNCIHCIRNLINII